MRRIRHTVTLLFMLPLDIGKALQEPRSGINNVIVYTAINCYVSDAVLNVRDAYTRYVLPRKGAPHIYRAH